MFPKNTLDIIFLSII